METDMKKVNKYFNHVMLLLQSIGVWPYTNPTLKNITSILAIGFLLSAPSSIVYFCVRNYSASLLLLINAIGQAVSTSTIFMKTVILFLDRDDLEALHDGLTKQFKIDLKEAKDRPHLLCRISSLLNLFHTMYWMTGAYVVLFGIKPMIILLKYHSYTNVFLSAFPFPSEPGSLGYWLAYSIQIVSCAFMFGGIVGIDCAFGLYSFQMCGEFRVLSDRYRSLKVNQNYRNELKDCIKRHQLLINSKNRLENLYGFITIWIAISGASVICSVAFQLSLDLHRNADVGFVAYLFIYLIPKLTQIFMYAYCGELLTEESKGCLDSIYNSYWIELCNKRFKQDILIVLTQEPVLLTAKGCMFIQLDMFSKVLNTSASYFYLLQSLSEGSKS